MAGRNKNAIKMFDLFSRLGEGASGSLTYKSIKGLEHSESMGSVFSFQDRNR